MPTPSRQQDISRRPNGIVVLGVRHSTHCSISAVSEASDGTACTHACRGSRVVHAQPGPRCLHACSGLRNQLMAGTLSCSEFVTSFLTC